MTDKYFSINLPLFKTKNNKFIIPDNIKKIWFDVGTSYNSPNGAQFLKRNEDGFCVGFEPSPRNYFSIYSLYFLNQNKWLVDNKHPTAKIESEKRKQHQKRKIFNDTEEFIKRSDVFNRYIFIPTAIGTEEGIKKLYDNSHEGSYSFNKNWKGNLNTFMDVNMTNLKQFIDMIPERFEYIEHLKIDCEGNDIDVIKSGGESIQKVAVITTETSNKKFMDSLGFTYLESQNGSMSFINRKYMKNRKELDYFIRV